jgi:hypothetical protein
MIPQLSGMCELMAMKTSAARLPKSNAINAAPKDAILTEVKAEMREIGSRKSSGLGIGQQTYKKPPVFAEVE